MRTRPLLAAAATAAVLLLTGCDPARTLAAEVAAATAGGSPAVTAAPRQPGARTLLQLDGVATPTPSPTSDEGLTVADLPLVVPTSAAATGAPLRSPSRPRQCGSGSQPHLVVPGAVAAGSGALTVSWMTYADPGVVSWQVTARDQQSTGTAPAPVWTAVPEASACQTLSVTLRGLTPGHTVVVWLVQVTTSPESPQQTWHQVGTSGAVVVR